MKLTASGSSPAQVLIVDDEADILELLELTLIRMGLNPTRAIKVADAIDLLNQHRFDLCLTDMRLSDGTGLELVTHIGQHHPELPVAVITAYGSTDNAIAALKAGAFDYIAKPVSLEQLRALVKSALSVDERPEGEAAPRTLLGESPAIRSARAMIDKLARSQAPVYITGESGSGKELAARLIHDRSTRKTQPFIAVNCGAIPENLMESEFFGYKKGAFTGAETDREGFFQVANGGTLFLDEVADLPLSMQVKLLRAIQEKKIRKVGAPQEEPVDVRIISATHQKLSSLVEAGKFRQDLYYRLNVIELKMPALREMREDISLIAATILERLAKQSGTSPPQLSARAISALQDYPYPGNVRELENILERAMALCSKDSIEAEELYLHAPEDIGHAASLEPGAKWPLQEYLDRVEREAILEALEKTRHNKTAAAKVLGITFRALRYRLERLGID